MPNKESDSIATFTKEETKGETKGETTVSVKPKAKKLDMTPVDVV